MPPPCGKPRGTRTVPSALSILSIPLAPHLRRMASILSTSALPPFWIARHTAL